MRTTLLLFLLAILPGMASGQQNPPPDQNKRSEDVVKRGEHVMGFSHEATTHHFRLFKDGGEIAVSAKTRTTKPVSSKSAPTLDISPRCFPPGISTHLCSFTTR